MKHFRTTLLLLLSSFPLLSGKASANAPGAQVTPTPSEPDDPVRLRPLNLSSDNLFAGHRSHSSHGSHRSSSGGGYSTPQQRSAPAQSPPPATPRSPSAPAQGFVGPGSAQPTDPGRAAPVSPKPSTPAQPSLSASEKRTLQIMRVQIALTSLGLYTGAVNGVLDNGTQEAIKRFQTVKGLETNGRMTTETLNSLGVPAVQ